MMIAEIVFFDLPRGSERQYMNLSIKDAKTLSQRERVAAEQPGEGLGLLKIR
jgi:hypothetical protein